MTKIFIALLLSISLTFNLYIASAAQPPIGFSCRLTDQFKLSPHSLDHFEHDLNRKLPILHGTPYLEIQENNLFFTLGKQPYQLGNDGLIAAMWGIPNFKTTFNDDNKRASLFFGNDGQDLFATKILANFDKRLNLEFAYFKTTNEFIGITATNEITKNTLLSIETSANLTTLHTGLLVTTKYNNTNRKGSADLSLSYHYIESTAVSDYSTYSDLANSKGFRLGTTYRITDNLTFTAFQGLSQTLDKQNTDQSKFTFLLTF
ncbi:MAG: hypothetical protein H6Q74_649 [Firmicutes bacterium]|nr:hypothetical protein [Bacillota bacterium]